MSDDRDREETVVLATYGTRPDAEVAREYLANADIQSFVSSDDAGGMYPQMQRPNGVKLIGMAETAQAARSQLEEAGLLPAEMESTEDSARGDEFGAAVYGTAIVLGVVAAILVLFMVVLG